MSRSLAPTDSSIDASAPIARPRVAERLAVAGGYQIALLIAPAGYGKSVALRQHLRSLSEPNVCFALRSEHSTLLGFLRGFAEALREEAPHAMIALAGAYERSTDSPRRGADLARWMHAHLENVSGVIAIDDVHVAGGDPEVGRFLTSLIERTKGKIRWILASRATTGLPIGTWLAYRDADLAIAEGELAFTLDEAREAADRLGLGISDDELADILRLTEGWPAAMSFALRSSVRSNDLGNISALTREMIYRLLAEQVYATLDDDERSLLDVAIALPAIDLRVLERAGFDRALTIIERLRERTAFIYEESPHIYQCHDLFRDFLRYQSALAGKRSQQLVHARAAAALEADGDVEHALASYAAAESTADILRLLEKHGFDLLERARSDIVARAVESLDDRTRRENAAVLALQGALFASAGKFARAESFFRRALARSGNDRDLLARTSLRLASLIGNQGREVTAVLDPISDDVRQSAAHRAEALSLAIAQKLIADNKSHIGEAVEKIESLMPFVEMEATRARVLHHLGIINRHTGKIDQAFERLVQAKNLALELHFYAIAARTLAVLSNLSLQERDDVEEQLRYAEIAANAGAKAGDVFAVRTALLQMLSAATRKGDICKAAEIERQLTVVGMDARAEHYVTLFRGVRTAWEGCFAEAHGLLAACWREMPNPVDRAVAGAEYALFLSLDGSREASLAQTRDVMAILRTIQPRGLFGSRALAVCRAFCALSEFANGRFANAQRLLRGQRNDDAIEQLVTKAATLITRLYGTGAADESSRISDQIGRLVTLGYGDVARVMAAVDRTLASATRTAPACLTASERDVLRRLAEGLIPKDIAAETGRSIHTVRVHIANAIAKLDCHGHSEAIRAAKRRGLI